MKMFFATLMALSFSVIQAQASSCISKSSIRSTEVVNESQLSIETGRGTYTVDLAKPCWGLDSPFNVLGFESFSSSFLCRGDDVLVLDRWNWQVVDRCWISEITKN